MGLPNVFISYSWDNDQHKEWVVNLMNYLRDEGVNAEIDRSITQQGTINLNRMMVENIRDNDYVIIVLTENYKNKAENYQGGVGVETTLIQSEVFKNPKKIIPIKKGKGQDKLVIPYYLDGLNYTDFSDDNKFEDSFLELLHRIKQVDLIEVSPIGKGRELKPKGNTLGKKEPNFYFKKGNQVNKVENGKVYEASFDNDIKQKMMIDEDGYHVEYTDEQGRVTYSDFDFNGGIRSIKPAIPWSEFKFIIPDKDVMLKQKHKTAKGYIYQYKFKWNQELLIEYSYKGVILAFESRVRTEVNYNNKTITVYPNDIKVETI